MKLISLKFIPIVLFAAFFVASPLFAQKTESGEPITAEGEEEEEDAPRDGIYDKHLVEERKILEYDHIREADVFWQKRIWRVIDVREKMNKPFAYPKEPFITILLDAAEAGEISLFSTMDDEFKIRIKEDEIGSFLGSADTVVTFDPETYEEEVQVVFNEFNPEDIKRFRVKEDWVFDEETSMMLVRILGIAPLKEVYDDNGNFRYEQPMFWAYYPELRNILARKEAFNPLNDAVRMSWEDIMEMRFFSSYIYKESNVYDRRIQDYKSGLDILLEGDKIKLEIFNYEHDLWEY